MKLTTLAIALVCLTSLKAYANDPNWNGDPEPEPPVVVVPDAPKGVDGDSEYDTYGRIYYGVCNCEEFTVAWGFESLELRTNKARMQCDIRKEERLKCPTKWK